jgi:hypothetical protein
MSAKETQEIELVLERVTRNKYDLLFWIGLSDENIEGDFMWMSNGKTANYTNWEEGQPSRFVYDLEADCVHLNTDRETWNSISCDDPYFTALCQRG